MLTEKAIYLRSQVKRWTFCWIPEVCWLALNMAHPPHLAKCLCTHICSKCWWGPECKWSCGLCCRRQSLEMVAQHTKLMWWSLHTGEKWAMFILFQNVIMYLIVRLLLNLFSGLIRTYSVGNLFWKEEASDRSSGVCKTPWEMGHGDQEGTYGESGRDKARKTLLTFISNLSVSLELWVITEGM